MGKVPVLVMAKCLNALVHITQIQLMINNNFRYEKSSTEVFSLGGRKGDNRRVICICQNVHFTWKMFWHQNDLECNDSELSYLV